MIFSSQATLIFSVAAGTTLILVFIVFMDIQWYQDRSESCVLGARKRPNSIRRSKGRCRTLRVEGLQHLPQSSGYAPGHTIHPPGEHI